MGRLVYLSSSVIPSPTANSVQVMKACEAFARVGAAVTLFAERGAGADPFASYRCQPIFELVGYPSRDRPKLPFGLRRRLADAAFARTVAKLRPDILYARSLRWLLRALAQAPSAVPVLELHEPPQTDDRRNLLRALVDRAPGVRLVTVSGQLRQDVLSLGLGIAPARVLVVRNGADPGLGEGDARALGPGFHVGYVGGLYPGCGVDVLSQAVAGLEGVVLDVVGGTPEEIARWQRDAPASAAIAWHGRVPHAQVGAFLRAFDVVAAPYAADAQGHAGIRKAAWMSPLKIFEAMAAGRAILASDLPAVRELLADGDTGWLLPAGEAAAWRAAITALRDAPAERARLGSAARAALVARHGWVARARSILAFLAPVPPAAVKSTDAGAVAVDGPC